MRVNREELLKQLESVLPGLSTREIIEQSSCFVFQDGKVITYNDEIACTQDCILNIEGAVQAMPLVNILRKLKEDDLDIEVSKDTLLIKGKRKRIGIRMDAEILLPVDGVDDPETWVELPDDFADAVSIVEQCSSKNENRFVLTCVQLHPKWVQACDDHQVARYRMKLDIKKPTLIRRDSLKYIVSLDMIEMSETKNWVHFRSSSGLVLSCRRWEEEYPKLSKILKVEGTPITFPKGLAEAAEKAAIFSVENAEDDQVVVNIQPNKVKITGRGASGYYTEIKKIKFQGESMTFRIPPKLFIDLINQHNECQVTPDRLKIVTGKYTYVTVLSIV